MLDALAIAQDIAAASFAAPVGPPPTPDPVFPPAPAVVGDCETGEVGAVGMAQAYA